MVTMDDWQFYLVNTLLTNMTLKMGNRKVSDISELEEQIILRLPIDEAKQLRHILRHKPENLKKLLKIDLDPTKNNSIVHFCSRVLFGTVKRFPTIIESYKTDTCNNKSVLFKTADICYIIECSYDDIRDNKIDSNHGYCPPLKNVKRNRFRKTMYNKDFAIEAEKMSKELYYLLSTDLEAASTRFEIYNSTNNSTVHSSIEDLFGNFTSTSSDSESDRLV